MLENTIIQWTIGILATILLGAIGSGFWDIALKPFSRYVAFKSMSITAFFFRKQKNIIYSRIATDDFSYQYVTFLYVTVFVLPVIIIVPFLTKINIEISSSKNNYIEHIKNITPEEIYEEYKKKVNKSSAVYRVFLDYILYITDPEKELSDLELKLKEYLNLYKTTKDKAEKYKLQLKIINKIEDIGRLAERYRLLYLVYINFILTFSCCLICFLLFFVLFSPVIYINHTSRIFFNYLDICTPYLPPGHRDLILSRFRQVASREDFVAVMNELQQIAEKEKLILPKYKIW